MGSKSWLLQLTILLCASLSFTEAQITIDYDNLVDDIGYPFTTIEYLKVIDSFLGGYGIYKEVPQSRQCMTLILDKVVEVNYTIQAWNASDTTRDYFVYE
mmetsp:Transcript_1017/g.1848  ORF Transcript_1017/g.1848 Transcript_1017/m.1848 type:complete len:100 (-) Transcript_1017:1257-1556(-)